MRQYFSEHATALVKLLTLAAVCLATASLVWLPVEAATLAPTALRDRLSDVDLSASTDGEDFCVVGAEIASFVDVEAIFVADVTLAPVCAARALR
jgi:hypothetical protein